ncbi:hypothetical protein PAXRUDRAFT_13589 [Paxillus rubicundulus Ve08.2h10]|uniref:Uncharacterized protein n=1 Tax=Paxillus rubicundulus Ve08.2h10 TaxID=930991 RepID=A0A0D0DTE7_9AGAM|nr:hypothetical protein PAXRUDRAFT_13589 [Paxillus rubicundulus Ve08.2h10]
MYHASSFPPYSGCFCCNSFPAAAAVLEQWSRLTGARINESMEVDHGDHGPNVGANVAGNTLNSMFNGKKLPHIGVAIECSTISEVVELIPQEYHVAVCPHFLKLADYATRYQEICCLLGRLQCSINTKKPLPYLRSCKLPSIQFSKEALSTAHVKVAARDIEITHVDYLTKASSGIKKAKDLEKVYYTDPITPKVYVPTILAVVQHVFNKHKDLSKVPTITNNKGELTFSTSTNMPQHILAQHSALLHELPVLGTPIVMLARAKVSAQQQHNDWKQGRKTPKAKGLNKKSPSKNAPKKKYSKGSGSQAKKPKKSKGQPGLK